jgi:NAD(P)H-nitrite reductase large subunit
LTYYRPTQPPEPDDAALDAALSSPTWRPSDSLLQPRLHLPPRLSPAASTLKSFDPRETFKVPSVTPGSHAVRGAGAGRHGQLSTTIDSADLVVIGNGIAGCIAAMETRQKAPDARILIITEQSHPTINTPALKQFGAGRLEVEHLLAYPAGSERQLGIDVIHQRVVAIDAPGHRIQLADGRAIRYRTLLLATGARATPLPAHIPGRDFDGVVTLHTLSDYLDLRRRLPEVSSAVVIGGGYHAAETAMLLRHRHVKVTWLIRGRGLLSRQIDPVASDLLLKQVRRQGVDVRLETEVAGVVGRLGMTAGVVTSTNEFLPCELVVVAIGAEPDSALAQHTALGAEPGTGIKVNELLQTGAQDIYAAGAVAAICDPQTGRYDARGQWYFAVQQGRLAAAAITGATISRSAANGAVGNFWHATRFEKLQVLVAGAPMLTERDHSENEVLTNGSDGFFRRIVVRHGHLVGYLAVGASTRGGPSIKRLIDERINIDEIKRQLLTEDFDVQSFFTRRRLHALDTGNIEVVPRPVAAPSRMLSASRISEAV